MTQRQILRLLSTLAIALLAGEGLAQNDESRAFRSSGSASGTDYISQVKPLLKEHCYRCHGASQQKAGLRLDTAAAALAGGDHGPAIQPGGSAESLMIQVLKGIHPEIPQMPYKKPVLSDRDIQRIAEWIDAGAAAPSDESPESELHWAFVPPNDPSLPEVKRADWCQSPIDYFILSRLEREGIQPSAPADRVTLIRRVSLDLTGLPPTPEEVEAFLNDDDSGAYERLVERLLSSPHYGERWARHWLDVARYADSNGYSIDAPRSIWKYRDWVIDALNRDLPFDEFVIDQLAGDLRPNATLEQKIATGFHRNTQVNQEGGIDPEQFRVESVIDRVNTTGTAFLGLTIGCAQCHDHKFDPVSQREYYQLMAFFNNTIEDGHGKGAPDGMLVIPNESESAEKLERELEESLEELDRYLNTKGSELVKWEQSLSEEEQGKLKPNLKKILKIPFSDRSIQQKRLAYAAYRSDDPEFKERDGKVTSLERRQPKPVTTLVMVEREKPRETHLFIKGDFTRPGDRVTPGVPAILHPMAASDATQPNRLDLAKWLVDGRNPLTARVTVNRVWQQYFGRGIVETENDFGTQGSLPTHPELLDWLATEFVARDWSLKHMHRLIVMSATYQQSSRHRPELANVDPNNKLLARQNRLRLDSEIVRDVALSASGLLAPKIGGPSVFPPQPDGVMTLGQVRRSWNPSAGADRYRRGMYTFFWRATPHPALTVFDAPDAFSACTRRIRSNTPLQALTLLNDRQFYEMAEGLAARVLHGEFATDTERLEYAFRLCVARDPDEYERKRLAELLEQQLQRAAGDQAAKRQEAWITVARVLLNLDETITRE